MASQATLDLIARDSRFNRTMKRVQSRLKRVVASMQNVAAAAKRMLIVGGLAIAGLLKLAAEQQRQEAKLEAALRATGGAAGFTAKQIKKQASELQKLTGIGDETIIGAQAIIATFKNISGENFEKATMAALDLAVLMDTDAKSAALALGKALNDPANQLGALSRNGVKLDAQQTKMIKTMVAVGDVAGAQAIIFKELDKNITGIAVSVGQTFHGAIKGAVAALGDIGEVIGTIFIPRVEKLTTFIIENKESVEEWIKRNATAIKVIVGLTATIALAVIGILAMTTVMIAATHAVIGLNVALTFLKRHPVIAALSLLAAGLIYLVSRFVKAEEAAEDLAVAEDKVKTATDDTTTAVNAAAAAEENWAAKRKKRADEREQTLKNDLKSMKEVLALQVATFGMDSRDSKIEKLRLGGATDEQLRVVKMHDAELDRLESLKKKTAELVTIEKERVAGIDAKEKSLQDEADAIRDLILTDDERTKAKLERLNVLSKEGRITADEFFRAQRKIIGEKEKEKPAIASIETALGQARRIAAAAATKTIVDSPAQQTAINTTKTATQTKTTAEKTKETVTTLSQILDLLQEVKQGLPLTGAFA